MCWGFECSDGWANIINVLCHCIQSHIDWSEKQAVWDVEWNEKNPDKQREVTKPCPQVIAVQVKEKFGSLRFYVEGGDDITHGMIRMAESMSELTCEVCGSPGKQRPGGWVKTLCDEHYNEREEKKLLKEGYEQ
jgi:hypothetical protein